MPGRVKTNLKFLFLLQGVSCMICWNSILSSLDWFNYHFKNYRPDFWFPISFFSLLMIIQPLILIYNNLFSHNIQIIPTYIISFIILLLIPLLTLLFPTNFAFFSICLLFSILGLFNTICQNGLASLAGLLSEHCINYLFMGFSTSGVLISVLRIIFIKAFPSTIEGYNLSTGVYFIIAASFQIASIVVQKQIMNSEVIKEQLDKYDQAKNRNYIELRSGEENETKEGLIEDYKKLFEKLWEYFFLDYFCFFITFLLLSQLSLSSSLR